MNITETTALIEPLERLLRVGSRSNLAKPTKYWYPLSLASFGLEEILEAIDSMASFRTSMWEKTAAFEAEFARYIGAREAIMVNSGSSADLLIAFSLMHGGADAFQPGDEVLIPAVTWPTQVWSVMMAGLKPVLVDVDPATLNIDLRDAEARLSSRTRGLFLVHLMGNPCALDEATAFCNRHDLVLLEDACEALGSTYQGRRVGAWGRSGCFSFFFSHHITTMEGGMVVCNDPSLADEFRLLRAHGWIRDRHDRQQIEAIGIDPRYAFDSWGFNVRPTEVQAGFGLRQLEKIAGFEVRREAIASRVFSFLSKPSSFLTAPAVLPQAKPSWLGLPFLVSADAPFSRDALTRYLEDQGIETRPIVAGNIARQPVWRKFPPNDFGALPGADVVHDRGFYIGLSPMTDDASIDRLESTFDRFLKQF